MIDQAHEQLIEGGVRTLIGPHRRIADKQDLTSYHTLVRDAGRHLARWGIHLELV